MANFIKMCTYNSNTTWAVLKHNLLTNTLITVNEFYLK
jgi:hypothetical protein